MAVQMWTAQVVLGHGNVCDGRLVHKHGELLAARTEDRSWLVGRHTAPLELAELVCPQS